MNDVEQRVWAAKLAAFLHANGAEVRAHHQEGSHGEYREADYVSVVGWLARGGYWLCEREEGVGGAEMPPPASAHVNGAPATHTGPHPPRPRLVP